MKKHIILFASAACIIFASCETETNDFDTATESNLTTATTTTFGAGNCDYEKDLFERQLHWFAFLSAKAAAHSEAAQTEINFKLNDLSNTGNTISAEDLIGPNYTMPNFRAAFISSILYYANGDVPDPDTEIDKPNPPIVPDPFVPLTPEEIKDAFLNTMLYENCVELYFPVGVNFGPQHFILTSAAHPLTDSPCNEAIRRYTQPQTPGGLSNSNGGNGGFESNPFETEEVIVKPSYLTTNDNIFIARPKPNLFIAHCTYNEYPGVDFTNFLD